MDNYNGMYNNNMSFNTPNFNMSGTQLTQNPNNDIKMISQEILDGLNNNNISLHDNESIEVHKKKKKVKKEPKQETQHDDYEGDVKCVTSFISEKFNLRELVLLFALYFVMSQEMVRDFFAGYFSSLNPDAEGNVRVQAILTYGLIFTLLFFILKLFLV